jgi:hypothetical protein
VTGENDRHGKFANRRYSKQEPSSEKLFSK